MKLQKIPQPVSNLDLSPGNGAGRHVQDEPVLAGPRRPESDGVRPHDLLPAAGIVHVGRGVRVGNSLNCDVIIQII